jgi:AraC-like DNA-binding protein
MTTRTASVRLTMLDLYEAIRRNPSYNKLEIGDFLFAEYTCGVTAEKLGVWTDTDYLMHVVTGAKTWHMADGIWKVKPGESLFVKKGANIVEQHFEEDVCMLTFFIPDALVRSTVRELGESPNSQRAHTQVVKTAAPVEHDVAILAFFQSMRTYFSGKEKPSEPLLRLKLKELIVSILTSGRNPGLAAYFRRIGASNAPSVAEIMETNFRYNLSLEEYAKLCHRSLSSFKREFQREFSEAPGKWLLQKRLEYSAGLLRYSKMNVTEVAFESGFEDVSHFSRVFKDRFTMPPVAYRDSLAA